MHTSSNVPSSSEEAESLPKYDARKKDVVKDLEKEGDMNGPGEATNTNSTNRLNTVISPVNTVSLSFTTVDPGRAREQRNEYESLFEHDKDNNNAYRAFTPVNTATPSNADYPIDPLMPNLEDTANLQDSGIFGNAYDDEDVGAEADINNLETTMSMEPKKVTQALDDESWMDVKSAFLYDTIEEEVYVSQPPGFVDLEFPNRVYKVEKALYGLHQAPRACVKTVSTPMETHKPLSKDVDGTDVDVHLYRSMIRSLMYLTSSRPNIMFAVYACSRFQVQPKASHMHAVKRIFRYLKGQPTLGLWYPKDSPLELIAYSDSDYVGASLDRKSTIGGSEYIATSNCCGQVLWLQNQLLNYGYNFIQTKIHVDNESAICVVKNPVYHSKTKHIEIRHYFIRDSYEKKLIEMVKIHIDYNVADLLTKAFDVTRFQFLLQALSTGSEEFHQIVDFLAGSHIRYALTTNPTIYVSLIEQFWQTATVEIVNDGEQQITVTVDGHTLAITEASPISRCRWY
ncbi:putative ribonuclease H-like domain-containing protein [Tanacetum coccineum]